MDIVTDKDREIDGYLGKDWKRVGHHKNGHTKIELLCPNNHQVFLRIDHIKAGVGCRVCSGLEQLNNSEIDNRLDKGWIRLSDYVNSQTHLELICPKGHVVRIKWANYQQGKRCAKCFKEINKGSTHPSWKAWLTDAIRERRARKNLNYKEWRVGVYKRDNYQCQVCGHKSKNLHAHHLRSFHNHTDLRYEISNGVTLCDRCHIEFHRRYGKENNTPEQFQEFRKLW